MKKLLILGIVAGMLTASAAYAYPTLAGPTGNGVLPTAAVAPAGAWNVAADFYNTSDNSYPIRVVYGIADNIELGGGYTITKLGGSDANTWNVNAKLALPIEPIAGFSIAAGARYASSDIKALGTTGKSTDVYLAATRGFAMGAEKGAMTLNGTLGVDWTKESDFVAAGSSVDGFRFFLAAETTLASKLSLSAEYKTKKSNLDTDALYAFTARYPLTDMISAQVGYTNADQLTFTDGTSEGNIFAGVNLTFGAAASEE